MLKKRQENIIIILEKSDEWITGKELSRLMCVTDRTIRSDIDAINKYYNAALIESNIRHGYHINQEVFLNLDIVVDAVIPETSDERCAFIIHKLLFMRGELNIFDLQFQLFVSSYSLENDIKLVRKKLESYRNIKLVRSKNYIRLDGDEKSKRNLYKDFLTKETRGNFLNLNNLATFYKDFDLLMVKEILEAVLQKYAYRLHVRLYPTLMIHIGIAIERMIHHNYLETEIKNELLLDTVEYKVATDFYKKVASQISIEVVDSEVMLMAILLMGKKSKEYTEDTISLLSRDYSISKLVEDILNIINRKFDIDFSKDQVLISGLNAHLQLVNERRSKTQVSSNVFLKEIKWKYPLIFEMAVEVIDVFGKELDIPINEDEIAFIALHLGAAYERSNLNLKYRAVLIHTNQQMLASMCIKKIETRFSDRVEIVECLNYFEESTVKKLAPDCIISTLPLTHNLPILTVQVSLFINYEDESKIFQTLNLLDKNRFKDEYMSTISSFIDQRFFYTDLDIKEPSDVIRFLCGRLQSAGYVSADYVEAVLKREEMSATSFANSFAIPHAAMNVTSIKSNLSIAILKNPIVWGEFNIQLVILLAINEKDQGVMRIFFDWVGNVVSNSKEFALLLQAKSRNEFVDLIIK